jgi:hypothetical protein
MPQEAYRIGLPAMLGGQSREFVVFVNQNHRASIPVSLDSGDVVQISGAVADDKVGLSWLRPAL